MTHLAAVVVTLSGGTQFILFAFLLTAAVVVLAVNSIGSPAGKAALALALLALIAVLIPWHG